MYRITLEDSFGGVVLHRREYSDFLTWLIGYPYVIDGRELFQEGKISQVDQTPTNNPTGWHKFRQTNKQDYTPKED